MSAIHELLIRHGVERAKDLAANKLDRQCIDAAFEVMSDEHHRIGVLHAGWAMAALPHKMTRELVWERQGGPVKLLVESGLTQNQEPIGLPYGATARMILLYLQSRAVQTRCREIELGSSMHQWLSSMGVSVGGKTYQVVREQSRRLSACRLTFFRQIDDHATMRTNGGFVRDAIVPSTPADQLTLWQDRVCLDEGFFNSLMAHPLPVRESAIRGLSSRSLAIDIYVWLAYRLHHLSKPTPIRWPALFEQFGAGFGRLRDFRRDFSELLRLALAVYPEARVDRDVDGIMLHPSPSPVEARIVAFAAPGRLPQRGKSQ
jgi:hypothetical protein